MVCSYGYSLIRRQPVQELTTTESSAGTIGLQKEHYNVVWVDACFAKLFN